MIYGFVVHYLICTLPIADGLVIVSYDQLMFLPEIECGHIHFANGCSHGLQIRQGTTKVRDLVPLSVIFI